MLDDPGTHADDIPLRGGHIVLDFLNTAGWHASEAPSEWLTSYDELARWARHAGQLSVGEEEHLRSHASKSKREAAGVVRRVIGLREALYRVCRAFVNGASAAAEDLTVVQRAYREAVGHARIAEVREGHGLAWSVDDARLQTPLWRLAHAAMEFLSSGELLHTRECAGAPCGWLFIDRSKNGSRRWCSSEECGNRERARRHRARQS